MKLRRRQGFRLVSILMTIASACAFAQEDSESSPHWNRQSCQVCHDSAAPAPGNLELKAEAPELLCGGCHGSRGDAKPCRHASDIPPDLFAEKMPDTLKGHMNDNKIVCTTCHDLTVQCTNPKKTLRYKNPGFLRGGRFSPFSEQCFLCHASDDYERLNPHLGVAGMPAQASCLLCHASMPESNDQGIVIVDFNMNQDLNDTCRGCHNVPSHPATMSFSRKEQPEWVHLTIPTAEVANNMKMFTDESGIELPLDPDSGRIFCATCHNPHHDSFGESNADKPGTQLYRLRADDMCDVCHEK